MRRVRLAFTLIELLVVIAIIAILAGILFPVFARARTSAQITTALSNMKQIGIGVHLYTENYDGVLFKIRHENGRKSWKHAIQPYLKNADVFRDPINPAAKLPDEQAAQTDPFKPTFVRGYFYYRPFFKTGNWQDLANYTMRSVHEPARALLIAENKDVYPDYGPWMQYLYNGQNGWKIPNWGGFKFEDKRMVVIFMDTHAKITGLRETCLPDDGENMWQYTRGKYVYPIDGNDTNMPWLDTFCSTLPF